MKKADDLPTYVTRAEFDALVNTVGVALAAAELAHRRAGYADGNVGFQLQLAERQMNSAPEHSALKRIMKAFDAAIAQHRAAERRRESERGNAYHQIT